MRTAPSRHPWLPLAGILLTSACSGRAGGETFAEAHVDTPLTDSGAQIPDAHDGSADSGDSSDGALEDGALDAADAVTDAGAEAGRVTGYPDGGGPVWGSDPCSNDPLKGWLCPRPAEQWCYAGRVPSCAQWGTCAERPTKCLDVCPGVCGWIRGSGKRFYCNDCLANADGACVVNDGPCD